MASKPHRQPAVCSEPCGGEAPVIHTNSWFRVGKLWLKCLYFCTEMLGTAVMQSGVGLYIGPEALGDFVAAFDWSHMNWEMGQQRTDLMWEGGDFWSDIFNEIYSNGLYFVRILQCTLAEISWILKYELSNWLFLFKMQWQSRGSPKSMFLGNLLFQHIWHSPEMQEYLCLASL